MAPCSVQHPTRPPPTPPCLVSRRACVKAPCWEPPAPHGTLYQTVQSNAQVWLLRASQRGDSLSRVLATPLRGISTF